MVGFNRTNEPAASLPYNLNNVSRRTRDWMRLTARSCPVASVATNVPPGMGSTLVMNFRLAKVPRPSRTKRLGSDNASSVDPGRVHPAYRPEGQARHAERQALAHHLSSST